MNIPRKRIGVYPPGQLHERQLTFAGLTELFPVVFEPFSPGVSSLPDACVFLGHDHPVAPQLDIPCYVWENRSVSLTGSSTRVMFSPSAQLHRAIRGQTLVESAPRELSFCSVGEGDTILANVADRPVWAARGSVHRVSVDLPHLISNELLYSYLVPARWLGLLPFIHFLRSVTADLDWQASSLRACFIIDDPNLHAPTYGRLDFRKVVQDAKLRNYHLAVATVPMDAWYVDKSTAHLFREHSDYLSLAMHGNEHRKCELTESDGDQLSRLAQALRRVDALERKTGLDVSRIMIAPHEACSEPTMDLMLRLGYEGMSIKLSKLLYWARDKRWPPDFGLRSVVWMGSGFPIVRRFRFRQCVTEIRLAAFLDQAIVLYGHPSDCSLELISDSADAINGIGVRWADLKSILRSNYRIKTAGDRLQIQMCSRYIKVKIPEQTTHISVERPWMEQTDREPLVYTNASDSPKRLLAGRGTDWLEVTPGSEITIQALPKEPVNYRILAAPRIRAWSMVRRLLVEARDRFRPTGQAGNARASEAS